MSSNVVVRTGADRGCAVQMSDKLRCARPLHESVENHDPEPRCLMHSRDPRKDPEQFGSVIRAIRTGICPYHRFSDRFDFSHFVFPEAVFSRGSSDLRAGFERVADYIDVADSDSLRNFDLLLLGGFSILALALASVGVYAVMAYSVLQRTREIGIRIALGAHSRDVLRLILLHGARLAITGSILGVISAFFLRKIMASFLFGLSANDPLVLSIVPCIMVLVILVACWLPARRATRIDPMVALRYE
jgi:hypothetical protein